ncbi:pentapeptide repeat-containing protein [Endozoicomonas numazuensis]|uniref:Uncharacterized protein n=1 Tax=Endozoicomonas numazuensis TaxID=1137799 RepID=A0A081NCK3_9GAMM|nr:pentapeptide repeat-containing protein [Endozoicomonas numazuensis]KEQ16176.1 hypothetical protein GZ78_23300 [Endozoicomonas numazuensis]
MNFKVLKSLLISPYAAQGACVYAPRKAIKAAFPCSTYMKRSCIESSSRNSLPSLKRAFPEPTTVNTKIPKVEPDRVTPSGSANKNAPAQLYKDFFEDTQALVRRFLFKPLPDQKVAAGEIPRMAHGAMHLSRAACWIPVLLEWRKQAGDQDAINFHTEVLPTLMKTALLHDSGREGEQADMPEWEQYSGENCEDHLLNTGVSPEWASACKNAIINKNRTEESGEPRTLLIEKLLHDADCLEIMRCRGNFDIAYLDIYKDFSSQPEMIGKIVSLATDIRDVVYQQSDMLYGAAITDSSSGKTMVPACSRNYSASGKAEHEFAENAMLHQINWLKSHSPNLYQLFQASAKGTQTAQVPDSDPDGIYKEVKGLPPQVARHRELMANLVRLLGINAPALKVQNQGYHQCTLQIPAATMTFTVDRSSLPKAERARLFLVASLLGQWDIANTARLDENGQLSITDLSSAGLYHNKCPKTNNQFSATPYELEWLRTPEKNRDSFPTCDDEVLKLFKDASSLFSDLTDEDIGQALSELDQSTGQQIDCLVERLGPDLPMDRYTFRRNLHQRLAFLYRRFPDAVQQSIMNSEDPCFHIQPCEQMAITASGIAGYCLPVGYSDIEKGELRLYQMVSSTNKPVTEAWLRLTPEATRRLADAQGIPSPWHRRFEILTFYINDLFQHNAPIMNPSLRAELQQLLSRCEKWQQELETEAPRIADYGFTTLAWEALQQSVQILAELLEAKQNGDLCYIFTSPVKYPTSFPTGLPGRVVMTPPEKHQNSQFNLKQHRHGHAWETQQWQLVGQNDNIGHQDKNTANAPVHHYRLPSYGWLDERVEADFFADDLSDAFSFAGIVRLRTNGTDQKSSQRLVNHLEQLGIDTHRATCAEHQGHYLREVAKTCQFEPLLESLEDKTAPSTSEGALLDIQGQLVCQSLQLQAAPQWQDYCQQLNGRAVYYRPSFNTDTAAEENGFRLVHLFNNQSFLESESYTYMDSETQAAHLQLLPRLMHCGHTLDSFVERVRKGIDSVSFFWRTRDIKSGGTSQSHFTVEQASQLGGSTGLIAKPLTMRRTDATPYDNNVCHFGDTHPEYVRHNKRPFDCPIPKNQTANETGLDDFSLEELETLVIPPSKIFSGFPIVQRLASSWPDGLPLENRLPSHHLEALFQKLTTSYRLPFGLQTLLICAGSDQFAQIRDVNPDFCSGHIYNLDGIHLTQKKTVEGLHLQGTSTAKANFSGVTFDRCIFENMDLSQTCLDNCTFVSCTFRNTTILSEQLVGTTHKTRCYDGKQVFQSMRQLSEQLLDTHRTNNRSMVESIDSLCRTELISYAELTDEEWQKFFQKVDTDTFSHWDNDLFIKKMLETKNIKFYPADKGHILLSYLQKERDFPKQFINVLQRLEPGQIPEFIHLNQDLDNYASSYRYSFSSMKFRPGTTLSSTAAINVTGAGIEGVNFEAFNFSYSKLSWQQIKQSHFTGYSFAHPDRLQPAIVAAKDYLRNDQKDSLQEKISNLQKVGLLDHIELTEEEFEQAQACRYLPLRNVLIPGLIDKLTDTELTQLQTKLCSDNSPYSLTTLNKGLIAALSNPQSIKALFHQNPALLTGTITSLKNCSFGQSNKHTTISPEYQRGSLESIDFSGSTFTGCNFYPLNITNCHFQGCTFNKSAFHGMNNVRSDSDFSGSRFTNCVMYGNNFHSVVFDACNLGYTTFAKCDLSHASFRECILNNNKWISSNLCDTTHEKCHAGFRQTLTPPPNPKNQ